MATNSVRVPFNLVTKITGTTPDQKAIENSIDNHEKTELKQERAELAKDRKKQLEELKAAEIDLKESINAHLISLGISEKKIKESVKVLKSLVPPANVQMSTVVSTATKANRAKVLNNIQQKAGPTFLPKQPTPASMPIAQPFNLEEANKNFEVWKSNRPKVDIQNQEPTQPEKPKIVFDTKANRWRNTETGKFVVSPTKAANPLLSKTSNSGILQGSDIQKLSSYLLSRKEKKARAESILAQKTDISKEGISSKVEPITPAKTSTNPVTIQNSKEGVKESDAESKEDQADQMDKIIDLLEKIEKNTSKDGKGSADDKKKKDDKGGLLGMLGGMLGKWLGGGLLALAGKFTKLFRPLANMFGKLLPLAGKLVSGIGKALLAVASLLGSGLLKAGGLIKDGFMAAKNKIFGTAAEKAASKAGTTVAKKAAEKGAVVAAEKAGTSAAAKIAAKAAAKGAARAIPGVGILAGAAFAAQRAWKGDWKGAALELGSGVAGGTGVGVLAGVGLTGVLIANDLKNAKDAEPLVEKMNKTGMITESEKKILEIANVDIPDGIEVLPDGEGKAQAQLAAGDTAKPKSAIVEPTPTSKVAQKMTEVEETIEETEEIEEKQKSAQAPTVINNITNNNSSSGKSGETPSGSRIFARNNESTLEKWLASRYVWQ